MTADVTADVNSARAGFSLIELLAVIVIIGILAAVLIPNITAMLRGMDLDLTRQRIAQIATACKAYESELDNGDYPPTTLPVKDVPDGGGTNRGAEALVVALWSSSDNGYGMGEDSFCNTDQDSSRTQLTGLGRELYELSDQWGNPIAYFHHADYGEAHVYVTLDPDTGVPIEGPVKALEKPGGGGFYQRLDFQLISAGPDGEFGTGDDLANFEIQ